MEGAVLVEELDAARVARLLHDPAQAHEARVWEPARRQRLEPGVESVSGGARPGVLDLGEETHDVIRAEGEEVTHGMDRVGHLQVLVSYMNKGGMKVGVGGRDVPDRGLG